MWIGRKAGKVLLVLGLGACGGTAAQEADAMAGGMPAPAPSLADDAAGRGSPASSLAGVAQEELEDADIAAIVTVANSLDIRNGELARERASDERVRQFAETMIADHTAVNESAQELVARLGVEPTMNEMTRSLQESGDQAYERLSRLSGADFDRAYIEHEVAYHRTVIDALDETLIPGATNEELREALTGTRPAFQAHLDHAQSLLDELGEVS